MEKKKKEIGFLLKGIKTEQYALLEENYDSNSKATIGLTTSLQFKLDQIHKHIGVFSTFKFMQNKKSFIKIEVSCHFKIQDESWNSLVHIEDANLVIPKTFLSHIAMITVGTARGILFSKTEGTPFSKFIIPTVNVVAMIKKDASFELDTD